MKPSTSKAIDRFNYLMGEIDAAYHEMSRRLGLSDSAMKILYAICDEGESCLLKEICRCSGLSKQTVNSAIRKMETDGIVYLQQYGAKEKKVCLTDCGKELAKRTAVRMIEAENEIFASWTDEDVQNYLTLTEQYLNDFRKKVEDIV